MSSFDDDVWYGLYYSPPPSQSWGDTRVATLGNRGTGAASIHTFTPLSSSFNQLWQLLPTSDGAFFLRCRGFGPVGWLGSFDSSRPDDTDPQSPRVSIDSSNYTS